MLVLGVIVSAIFSSLISLLKYIADPYEQLPSIVFWMMGSLATARFQDIGFAIPMAAGLAGLIAMRWRLNILSMGDDEAQALGVNVLFTKGLAIFSLPWPQPGRFVWRRHRLGRPGHTAYRPHARGQRQHRVDPHQSLDWRLLPRPCRQPRQNTDRSRDPSGNPHLLNRCPIFRLPVEKNKG